MKINEIVNSFSIGFIAGASVSALLLWFVFLHLFADEHAVEYERVKRREELYWNSKKNLLQSQNGGISKSITEKVDQPPEKEGWDDGIDKTLER